FLICAAPAVLRALVLPPMGWDALTLHATKAAMWVQHGAITGMQGSGPWAYYQPQMGGAEVFQAWAMLPVRSDLLVPIVDVVAWIAFGLSIAAFARRARIREPYASTAAAFVVALPTVRLLVGSGYVELPSMAAMMGGLAIGLIACRRRPALF